MSYPGDASLDPKVQQRILAAFGEAVRLYRDEHAEEARTILRSIVEVDPRFIPAQTLDMAIEANAPVNLSELLGEISAAAPVKADEIVASIKGAMDAGDYQGALVLAQSLLRELPGHSEGRRLALAAQSRLRQTPEVDDRPTPPTGKTHPPSARAARGAEPSRPAVPATPAAPLASPPPPPSEPHGAGPQKKHEPPAASPPHQEDDVRFEFLDEADAAGVFSSEYFEAEPSPEPAASAPAAADTTSGPAAADTTSGSAPQTEGIVFEDRGGDGVVDFSAAQPQSEEYVFGDAGEASAGDAEARVRDLLDRGQDAFSRGEYQEAIDTWSRIFLIDAHNAEAERRIEQARQRREEVDRLAEHHFYEAREALEKGDPDQARKHCEEVLKLQPQHFEAHDMLQRLETPAAPPPPVAPPPPEDEPDIFRDDFVPDSLASSGAIPAVPVAPPPKAEPERRTRRRFALPRLRGLPLPLPVLAGLVGLAVVLLVGGFLLRGRVFSGSRDTVEEAVNEADGLAAQGRFQEAINLLQAVEAEGAQAQEVSQKMLEYRRRLRAQPTPPPALNTAPVKEAVAAGDRLKALRLLRQLRGRAPGNPELDALERHIVEYSGLLPGVLDAVDGGQWDLARQRIAQALREHPDDAELQRAWEAATFNDAVLLLRKYEIAAAHSLLTELASRNHEPEVERLKELASSYLSRPVDPKYQIFVASVELRSVD
jgi:tetratricopeptide (TPR) repeat protein